MRWKVIAMVFVAGIVLIAGTLLAGTLRWRSSTKALNARMETARVPAGAARYDAGELEGLPAPVQRYFRAVLKHGQPLIAAAIIEHRGTFSMSEAGEDWKPFSSSQHVVIKRPGFVWDARIRMAPGVVAHVHDAYVAGEGVLTATLFGLVTVMSQPSTPELAHGELMRFLAETAWYPTALLPSQGVIWEAIDENRARATLTDGATTVNLEFEFDADGLISSVRSDGRYRDVGGEQAATPWEGRFGDYAPRDGMLIPLDGEVSWLLADGAKPYWRGRIERIEYEMN